MTETIMFAPAHIATIDATFRREIAEHRLNRFLHVHLTLCALTGLLPLFTPDAAARSAPAWVLQAVLYCLSLSSLLLGLSAAHGDADEFPVLFTQFSGRATWLAGKGAALAALLGPAVALTIAPAVLTSGLTSSLLFVGAAAAGVCLVLALLGLAIGCWVRDHVRGLLVALGVWFMLLFGVELLLLAISGSPLVQQHANLWALPVMLNPLSALRVTMLFTLERTAPASIGTGMVVGWWLGHGGLWLAGVLAAWGAVTFRIGVAGARRRLDF
jgi:Cu-processing system permease protein